MERISIPDRHSKTINVYRVARVVAGLTMQELAPLIGVSWGWLAQVERGEKQLSAQHAESLMRICRARWIERGRELGWLDGNTVARKRGRKAGAQ